MLLVFYMVSLIFFFFFFFFNDTATTEIYTLSLHDALPIAAAEPVAGITYHTFGGSSTDVARLWASVYTPDSTMPLPLPFPLFHWGSVPIPIGTLLNAVSFAPAALIVQLPRRHGDAGDARHPGSSHTRVGAWQRRSAGRGRQGTSAVLDVTDDEPA